MSSDLRFGEKNPVISVMCSCITLHGFVRQSKQALKPHTVGSPHAKDRSDISAYVERKLIPLVTPSPAIIQAV